MDHESTRTLADALGASGHRRRQHPDCDARFRYLNNQAKSQLRRDLPMISVDTKKKGRVGEDPGYKNGGRECQPQGSP